MNETAVDALTVHGTNPQFLIEKITRYILFHILNIFLVFYNNNNDNVLDQRYIHVYIGKRNALVLQLKLS